MRDRPMSVTVIAWILVASGIYSIFTGLFVPPDPLVQDLMAQSMLSPAAVKAWSIVNSLVSIAIAVALLKQRDWARYAYVVTGVIGVGVGYLITPFVWLFMISLLVLAFLTFLLFRRSSSRWFAAGAQ